MAPGPMKWNGAFGKRRNEEKKTKEIRTKTKRNEGRYGVVESLGLSVVVLMK